jgi:Enoyl-(Acyl carrier protein) reductase
MLRVRARTCVLLHTQEKLIRPHGVRRAAGAIEASRSSHRFLDSVPGRIGNEEDIAGAAIYLASRAGDYVVGATLTVDGGIVYANPGIRGSGWDSQIRPQQQCRPRERGDL